MSLTPKYLNKLTFPLKRRSQANLPKNRIVQWGVWASLMIVVLSGCQDKPSVTPPSPTISATPSAIASKDKVQDGTLERVKTRGKLICGVNGKLLGFSFVDDKGNWNGLDVDYCRAIAAAVLGDVLHKQHAALIAISREGTEYKRFFPKFPAFKTNDLQYVHFSFLNAKRRRISI